MRAPERYFDHSGRDDVLSGGVKLVPITTPKGEFRVWTKRTGNNPTVKVLLLHGGPGATHEYLEACDSWFPAAGIEYYYYDQLGSTYSDQPWRCTTTRSPTSEGSSPSFATLKVRMDAVANLPLTAEVRLDG